MSMLEDLIMPWNPDETINGNGFLKIREGYLGVGYRRGKMKKELLKPGMHLNINLWGWMDDVVVVDCRSRTMPCRVPSNVMTKGGVEVEGLDFSFSYRVSRPDLLLKGAGIVSAEDGKRYETILREYAENRIRTVAGDSYLTELGRIDAKIISGTAEEGNIYEDINKKWDLKDKYGVEIESITIAQPNIPDTMRDALAAEEKAKAEAKGMIASAQGRYQAALIDQQTAALYGRDTPETMMELRKLSALEKFAENGNTNTLIPSSLFDGAVGALGGNMIKDLVSAFKDYVKS